MKYQTYFDEYKKFILKKEIGNKYLSKADLVISVSKNCQVLKYNGCKNRVFFIIPSIFNSPEIFFINQEKNFVEYLSGLGEVYLINWLEIEDENYNFNNYVLEALHALKILSKPGYSCKEEKLFLEEDEVLLHENDKDILNHKSHPELVSGSNNNCYTIDNCDHYTFKRILKRVQDDFSEANKFHMIGHCIGGNIAIGVSVLAENLIASLTLLTTPWDFSHFNLPLRLYYKMNLENKIHHSSQIPKSYIQVLFFLLFPNDFNVKIDKYLQGDNKQKEFFLHIQHWLLSGNNLPSAFYNQLIGDIIPNNMFMHNKWRINFQSIDPQVISVPFFILVAKKDKLVPINSTMPLSRILKDSKVVIADKGHINYLVGSEIREFFNSYEEWLLELGIDN